MPDNSYTDTMRVGEEHLQEFNAAAAATNAGSSLGTVTWSSSDSGIVSLSSQSESGNRTQVLSTAVAVGTATLTCTAEFGSQTVVGTITIEVS